MEKIIEFIGNNYTWFLTITIILLFALIGYIYDNRKNLKKVYEDKNDDNKKEEFVEELKLDKNLSEEEDKDQENPQDITIDE